MRESEGVEECTDRAWDSCKLDNADAFSFPRLLVEDLGTLEPDAIASSDVEDRCSANGVLMGVLAQEDAS